MAVSGAPPARVEVAAPAKVNLALLVGPRRGDGYHEVFSLMLPVTLADLVVAERLRDGGVLVDCPVSPGEDNLVAHMAHELERRLERRFHVRFTIAKRVPHGAGLGGGSSDAAAALVALERLYDLRLPPRVRHEAAAAVGSDVPFFLWPGPQVAMGRGQALTAVDLPEPLHLVVAVPDLALSTETVYRWRDEDVALSLLEFAPRTQALLAAIGAARRPADIAALVHNDLEAHVAARHPRVGALKQALLDAGARAASMSGSGAAVFGLFEGAEAAEKARARLASARAFCVSDLQPRAPRSR
jgi:4-diphosphocytidyl-2-C-methyl-D-erythritol kinase